MLHQSLRLFGSVALYPQLQNEVHPRAQATELNLLLALIDPLSLWQFAPLGLFSSVGCSQKLVLFLDACDHNPLHELALRQEEHQGGQCHGQYSCSCRKTRETTKCVHKLANANRNRVKLFLT